MQAHLWFILLLSLTITPALAAEASDKSLLEELRALAEKARRQQAADRWLQRALDDLVARYDRPWQRTLFFDDFRDGNYTADPRWERLEGHFEVLRNRGLVAWGDDREERHAGRNQEPRQRDDRADLGAALVGALLQQALGPPPGTEPSTAQGTRHAGPNRLRARVNATNAFALSATLVASEEPPTQLELALLQSKAGRYGYRLRLQTGPRGFIELERIRNGRGAIVESKRLEGAFADGRLHDLVWQQAPNGKIKVMLDEKTLFETRDRAFRDGYPWLELRHEGGELAVRAIRIEGT